MDKSKIVVCDHIHEAGLEMLRNDDQIDFVFASASLSLTFTDAFHNTSPGCEYEYSQG